MSQRQMKMNDNLLIIDRTRAKSFPTSLLNSYSASCGLEISKVGPNWPIRVYTAWEHLIREEIIPIGTCPLKHES